MSKIGGFLKFRYFKPALVLGLITTVISAALIVTSNFLPDTSEEMTDKLHDSCVELMGEGEYNILTVGLDYSEELLDKVNKVIKKKNDDSVVAFEITTSGYKPDSITVLVAVNEYGTVIGIIPLSVNDSPGYSDKVRNPDFLAQFTGATPNSEFDGITGATYSANGVIEAVEIALEPWREDFDE